MNNEIMWKSNYYFVQQRKKLKTLNRMPYDDPKFAKMLKYSNHIKMSISSLCRCSSEADINGVIYSDVYDRKLLFFHTHQSLAKCNMSCILNSSECPISRAFYSLASVGIYNIVKHKISLIFIMFVHLFLNIFGIIGINL